MSERISRDGQQDRKPRALQTRESQARTVYVPASTLPTPDKRPGVVHRWVATEVLGQSYAPNVSKKMREGWEPVKLADHPEMKLMVDQNSRFKDGVEIGGLLLCKIPQEFVDQRKAHYATQAKQQADAVDNSFLKQSDARMPLFSEKKATTSFGKGN